MPGRVDRLLHLMRADAVPAGRAGLWQVRKTTLYRPYRTPQHQPVPPGSYTCLHRAVGGDDLGDTVMVDHEPELRTHLEPVLRAHGRVLVTGLGLGCVVRGVLASPAVTILDVVERSEAVLQLVAPYLPDDPRLRLHQADALRWLQDAEGERWDVAWHDLWSDPDREEPHLAVTHTELMVRLRGRVGWQAAWAYPRHHRRAFARLGVGRR